MSDIIYAPNALEVQTNLTGSLTDIDENVDSPDGSWLTAPTNVSTTCRVGFETPAYALTVGAGLQEFRAWVRWNSSRAATATIELWENGSQISASNSFTIDTAGEMINYTWNASVISNPANVQCVIQGTPAGSGPGGQRSSVEIGAVQWDAVIDGPDVKTLDNIALASVKEWDSVAIATYKTFNGWIL
jgi:hypothetical protein